MYCYMEADKCGVRGVMRVGHIDMRISSVNCPAPLTQNQLDSGESNACTKTADLCDLSYPSLHLYTNIQYMCVGNLLGSLSMGYVYVHH